MSTVIKGTNPWAPRCVYSSILNGDLLGGMFIYVVESEVNLFDNYDTPENSYKTAIHKLQNKRKLHKNLVSIENFEHKYEQSEKRVISFILFCKIILKFVPKIKDRLNLTQHVFLYLTDAIRLEKVVEFLSEIQIIERGQRQVRKEDLLELMSSPVLQRKIELKTKGTVIHISCLNSDRFWISNMLNNYNTDMILTNTEGEALHRLICKISTDRWNSMDGAHTVNNKGELIHIDNSKNIYRLSTDNKTRSLLIIGTDFREWEPRCVYYSAFKGELLVGLLNAEKAGKVNRYSSTNQHIQTIQHDYTGQGLYSNPHYITENRNGNVIVSDSFRGVVVTDRKGRHRFTYTGPPSGSRL
ncbi:uncharacterized protein LOC134252738 [Saccostrea cucullata]|uniref:uncharacterized protein LOC134252738 n=1 Tax=Saccostrea cuccullata TaxID=36930 RepID=UPI002ED199C7